MNRLASFLALGGPWLLAACPAPSAPGDDTTGSSTSVGELTSSGPGVDGSGTSTTGPGESSSSGDVDSTGTTGAGIDDPGCPECIVLVDGLMGGRGIDVDTDYVYVTDQAAGVVSRILKGGGEGGPIAEGQDEPYEIAVGDGYAYWTNFSAGGGVMRVPVAGGMVEVVEPVSNSRGIAFSGGYVYWSTFSTDSGQILRRSAGLGAPVDVLAYQSGGIPDLVVDGDTVYFTSHSNSDGTAFIEPPPMGPPEGRVLVATPTGDPFDPTALVVDQAEPWGIARSGGLVVWANGDGDGAFSPNRVQSKPTAGGPVSALAVNQLDPWGVAADEQHAYFTDNDEVKAVPLAGGEVIVLAEQQNQARGIVVDDQWVFWVTRDRVLQRAKP